MLLDKYGTKRTKLFAGDDIIFKQKDNPTRFNDYIWQLKDTSLVLGSVQLEMPLSDFDSFYFQRNGILFVSAGSNYIAGGFLFAAAVEPLISDAQYSAQESALIGASFFAFAQLLKLFKWKKFKIGKRGRARIINTSFR